MVKCNTTNTVNSIPAETDNPRPAMVLPLGSIFRPNCIEMIRPATGKSSTISILIQALTREEQIDRQRAEEIIRQLIDRERHSSSAIGKGLAFPHLRTRDVDRLVGAIGVAPEGIQFGALDNAPTKLVFLSLTPWEDREQHIHLMSRLVRLMNDKAVHMQMNHRLRPQAVYQYLTDLDHQPEQVPASD